MELKLTVPTATDLDAATGLDVSPMAGIRFDRFRDFLPGSVTVAQEILVLFVQVRILAG